MGTVRGHLPAVWLVSGLCKCDVRCCKGSNGVKVCACMLLSLSEESAVSLICGDTGV